MNELTKEKVEEVLKEYFGNHMRKMNVTEYVLCIHAYVMYDDFKTQLTAQRELMDLLPGVFIELERGYTDEVMLDSIYSVELEDSEIYVNGIGGVLKKTTVHEYLNEYLNGKELA